MSISSDEVNYLVYRYLLESGFSHSAFSFAHESLVARSVVADSEVPPGALLCFLQKGLQYVEIESHLQEDGTERACDEPFHLLAPHVCRVKAHSVRKAALDEASGGDTGSSSSSSFASPEFAIAPADVRILTGHGGEVFTCAFNPLRPDLLATGSGDGTGRIWEVAGEAAVSHRELLHAPPRGSAPVGDAGSGKDVASLDWSPDGQRLATGCYDARARIWGMDGSLLAVLSGHTQPIFSSQWSPSGQYLLTGSVDMTAIAWDGSNGALTQQFAHHAAPVLDIDWATDTQFATCSSDKSVNVWNIGERAPVRTFVGHADEVNCIGWSPCHSLLASGSDDGFARLWSLSELGGAGMGGAGGSGSSGRVDNGCVGILPGHKKSVYRLEWAPTGDGSPNPSKPSTLATASFDSTVKLWDPTTLRARANLARHTAMVYAIAFSPSGDILASGSSDRCVHLWNVADGSLLRTYTSPAGVFDVSFNARGDSLAVCCANGTVSLIDLKV